MGKSTGRAKVKARGGRVRIIGGRWRGRRIVVPDVAGLRPTPDRVRETVFNWLAPYVTGARVLDLYAGSGILGLEALSRGAASVTAVESHPAAARRLRACAQELEAADLEVVARDAMDFLSSADARPFDIVFLDPPHASADYGRLCTRLETSGLLRPGALIYVESTALRGAAFAVPESWTPYRTARAGHLAYRLWRQNGAAD